MRRRSRPGLQMRAMAGDKPARGASSLIPGSGDLAHKIGGSCCWNSLIGQPVTEPSVSPQLAARDTLLDVIHALSRPAAPPCGGNPGLIAADDLAGGSIRSGWLVAVAWTRRGSASAVVPSIPTGRPARPHQQELEKCVASGKASRPKQPSRASRGAGRRRASSISLTITRAASGRGRQDHRD